MPGTAPTTTAVADRAVVGTHPPLRPVLRGIGLFIGGFTLVFVALGAVASSIGQALDRHRQALPVLAGILVVALGVVLLVTALPGGFWTRVGSRTSGLVGAATRERRFQVHPSTLGAWAAPVMGMAFAFAWTPCLGPVLAAILGLAAARATLADGVALLFAYSLGLGVPFLVTGLAFGRLTTWFARTRHRLWIVNVVAGGILVTFGILLLCGQLGWLSSEFTALLNHLGLGRLTRS